MIMKNTLLIQQTDFDSREDAEARRKKMADFFCFPSFAPLRLCVSYLFAALLFFANIANAFEVNFAKDDLERLFDTETPPVVSDGLMTIPSRIETRALPVTAGKKYKLEMAAQVDGDFVVEKNTRAHIMARQQPHLSSVYRVVFQNASGGEVRPLGGVTPDGFFLTQALQPYVSVFYAPPEATGVKVYFQANGRKTQLANLRLVEETEEKTLNPNPDFRYGELNYSGWQSQRDGRLYKRPDGKVVFNGAYSARSPAFPLEAGRKYRASAIGQGGAVEIQYFDRDGKSLLKRHLLRPADEGAEAELIPPAGTVAANFLLTGGAIVQEVKIVEAK